jgi:hypothetical protein
VVTRGEETPMTMTELEQQTARQLDALRRELEGSESAHHVTPVGNRHFAELRRAATVHDFIPLLVYRLTREELVSGTRETLHDSA